MSKAWKLGVLGCVLFALFALLAVQVVAERTTAFDEGCTDFACRHAADNSWCLDSLRWLTNLGGAAFLVPFGLVVIALLSWQRQFRLVALWAVVAVGGYLCNEALKHTWDRPRPPEAVRDATVHEPSASPGLMATLPSMT